MFVNEWTPFLKEEFQKDYFKTLSTFLHEEYEKNIVYPKKNDVFNAFKYTDIPDLKVVILGQDPYHGPNQAVGLSFAVNKGIDLPPSLKNIYKELSDDLGIAPSNNGYLVPWAKQGVMLLNTVLTVRARTPLSHQDKGWEIFTDTVIKKINQLDQPIVFILWGSKAIAKAQYLTNPKHLILKAAHPSPMSAYNGFFGCRHFSKTNDFLVKNGLSPIDWRIPNV